MKTIPKHSDHKIYQLIHWIFNPLGFMENCAQKYGDIFQISLGKNNLVMVSNPEALQEIFTNDNKIYDAPGELNTPLFGPFLGENSVVSLSGERHKRDRQLMMPPFHGERMKSYGQIISDLTKEVMNTWQVGQNVDVRDAMQTISLRVMIKAVFGITEGESYQKLEQLLKLALDDMASPYSVTFLYFPMLRIDLGNWTPWGKFQGRMKAIDELVYAEISARRANFDPEKTDILNMLISAVDDQGEGMTDMDLRDELMTLLFAGHETTATALTWALYWIYQDQNILEKLRKELDSLGPNPDFTAIFKLPYLTAVCNETLRIYPVIMLTFPRRAKTANQLLDYELNTDTYIIGSIYLTHQREDLYPDHQKFDPERFLNKQYSPYEFMPFGGGVRRCLGMAFAQFEMKLALAEIINNYDCEVKNPQEVKPVRRGLTSAPNHVKLIVKAIKNKPAKILDLVTK